MSEVDHIQVEAPVLTRYRDLLVKELREALQTWSKEAYTIRVNGVEVVG